MRRFAKLCRGGFQNGNYGADKMDPDASKQATERAARCDPQCPLPIWDALASDLLISRMME